MVINYYKSVQEYFAKGYYTIDQVKTFLDKGKITQEEYLQITGA